MQITVCPCNLATLVVDAAALFDVMRLVFLGNFLSSLSLSPGLIITRHLCMFLETNNWRPADKGTCRTWTHALFLITEFNQSLIKIVFCTSTFLNWLAWRLVTQNTPANMFFSSIWVAQRNFNYKIFPSSIWLLLIIRFINIGFFPCILVITSPLALYWFYHGVG